MAEKTTSEKSPRPWGILLAVAVILAAFVVGKWHQPRVAPVEGFLNNVTTLTLAEGSDAARRAHTASVRKRIAALEQCISSKTADAELVGVNAHAAQEPVPVSEELFAALTAGVEWHNRTGGAFDITIGPLLTLWHKSGAENRLPTEEELGAARALVGADRLVLDGGNRTIRIPVEDMQIDLGGLGKGLCADEVAKLLKERGVTSALVAVAGDIRAVGKRGDGKPWCIGIQDPREPGNPDAMLGTLELVDMAVSTSGNYERFVQIQGTRYSHIVDPRSGRPADEVPSVTVIGPNALTTDIMGTALSVLGVEEGLALVERMKDVEAIFILFDAENTPQITRSSGFAAFEAD